jgi:transcriptional regulator with XRE-family HTH domain
LLAQVANIERGTRIRERREALHLTQPAVVELLEEAAKALPETHDLNPKKAGKAPVTLRGYQSYEQGGGIVWEKAKLLAGVLQMDVQSMMNGEPEGPAETPDPFAKTIEGELAQVLGELKRQLQENGDALAAQTRMLTQIMALLGEGGAADRLDATLRQAMTSLESAARPQPVPGRKTVQSRNPRASS